MAYTEFCVPHFVSTERFARDLGTAAHRKKFEAACARFRRIRAVAEDVLYPARHAAARAALAGLPVPQPKPEQMAEVFDLMKESARQVLHDQLIAYSVERFEADVRDDVRELTATLAGVLEKEAARLDADERELAKSWGIPRYRSPLLESVAGTARELRDRLDRGFEIYNGDQPERLLGGWFPEPLQYIPSPPAEIGRALGV